jgi:hypothetical protein
VPFTVTKLGGAGIFVLSGRDARPVVRQSRHSVSYDAPMEAASGTAPSYPPASQPVLAGDLDDRDRAIFEFERQWWRYAGGKEQAVRELFGMSATRYYQVLNALIDRPEAMAHDPMLVKRLRRLRSSRQRARSARRLGLS